MIILHAYHPEVWDAQVKDGFVREGDGIRFCQSLQTDNEVKFNELAAKGGTLYNICKTEKRPFYIDRLQGGSAYQNYVYDEALLAEYKEMLGENFWGFQMHEWLSNYFTDLQRLVTIPEEEWDAEHIRAELLRQFPYPFTFIESMNEAEMAAMPRPKSFKEHFANMTSIYKKRRAYGDLIPCDSAFLAYNFEIQNGAKRLLPEIGAQTPYAHLQISYARGMARHHGIDFGVYYETWGGEPFSTCCYHEDARCEWRSKNGTRHSPFAAAGANGGSSRTLQWHIFLYAYLSNADFLSEEWGLCNVYENWKTFPISPYGEVKKRFIGFLADFPAVGKKLAPVAVVLPKELDVLDEINKPKTFCRYPVESPELAFIKNTLCALFATPTEMLGNERPALINSEIPDAIDVLNDDGREIKGYDYLIDLTCNENALKGQKAKRITAEEAVGALKEALPCFVEGGAHFVVNECTEGGYYLSIFNHSGIQRTVADGESILPEAAKTLSITFKNACTPSVVYGTATLQKNGDAYTVALAGGDFVMIRF